MSNPFIIRIIRGVHYRQLMIINPGECLYITTGRSIAVETWAVPMGQHEFDYGINSRATDVHERPISIASTSNALEAEFMERRIVVRQAVPFSIGDSNGNKIPEIDMTYGEVAPQVYHSKQTSPTVAWSINFKGHRLVSAHSVTKNFARKPLSRKQNGIAMAKNTPAMQNVATSSEYLMIYVPVSDYPKHKIYREGFGTMDIIGTDRSWLTRVFSK
jgi:hypothetical protein